MPAGVAAVSAAPHCEEADAEQHEKQQEREGNL